MLSGPVELLFEDLDIASLTWIEVMIIGVVGKVLVWLSIRLFLALMVYLTVDELFVESSGFFLRECCQFAIKVDGRVRV